MSDPTAAALRLRQFNRFYTRRLGLLDAGHLDSPFSLAEVRVLYELAHRDHPTASDIAALLGMDEGYLSRLLRRFRQRGLVRARRASTDGRQRWLSLTPAGQKAYRDLDERATAGVVAMIQDLDPADRQQLVDAAVTIEALLDRLTAGAPGPGDAVELRTPLPGDLGWVVERHGEVYGQEYGWNAAFERLVAGIVGEYAAAGEGPVQRCWIATVGGRRAGSIFLMPGPAADVGRLRLLLVEPWARGRGVGSRLVEACIEAARSAGLRRITLWTNDVLAAARHLYERAGFQCVHRERHTRFGKPLEGQTWELDL